MELKRVSRGTKGSLKENVNKKNTLYDDQNLPNVWEPYEGGYQDTIYTLDKKELKRLLNKLKKVMKDDGELKDLLEGYGETLEGIKEYVLHLMYTISALLEFLQIDVS